MNQMENQMKRYYQLALSYFNGNLPLKDEKALFDFISSDSSHRELFRQWEKKWMVSSVNKIPVTKEWNELQHRLRVRSAINRTFDAPKRDLRKMIAAAAILLVLLISSVTLLMNVLPDKEQPYYTFVTDPGEKSRVVLTDGTNVWLNAGSKLRYSGNFSARNREVILEGEAYFEVKKQNDKSPFRVKTDHYDILVKGTKFNVTSYAEDPASSVTLLEGAVEIVYGEGIIPVKPGESLSFKKGEARFFRHNVQAYQYKSWIDGRVEYDEITLNELAVRLSRKYDVNIFLDGDLEKDAVFKVSLRNEETIDQFLQALSKIIDIRFRRVGHDIYIMKKQ